MKKIWTDNNNSTASIVDDYCFKEGVAWDNYLTIYDIYGSIAHAKMLAKAGIINNGEYNKLKKSLKKILDLHAKSQFSVTPADEDIHTKVESYLTEKLGDLGKKIHTGRSRNDQVLLDLRLYAKFNLIKIAKNLVAASDSFLDFAEKYQFVPMPGYTHMQKAMPSSVAMWAGSFAEQFADLLVLIKSAYDLNNQSPLGTGAAYGVSLPIDRELTAKNLGFSKVQNNSLYTQISRPTIQLITQQALFQIMLAASRFAQDLLLFTTREFSFFDVSESVCTGSSIMPQKKNLDLMEYVRAKTGAVMAYEFKTATIASGLPSGYNADFGEIKGALMDSFSIVDKTLDVLKVVVKSIKPNEEILKKACTAEIYATHQAYRKVIEGVPFRNAYLEVKQKFNEMPVPDPVKFLKESKHTGGTGNLALKKTYELLVKQQQLWTKESVKFNGVISSLIK